MLRLNLDDPGSCAFLKQLVQALIIQHAPATTPVAVADGAHLGAVARQLGIPFDR